MRIVVHIDRLVLDGVGQTDLPRLQAALEATLAQTLGERAPISQRTEPGALAPVDVSRGPEAIGQAIARAAHAHIASARVLSPAAAPPAARSPALSREARP